MTRDALDTSLLTDHTESMLLGVLTEFLRAMRQAAKLR